MRYNEIPKKPESARSYAKLTDEERNKIKVRDCFECQYSSTRGKTEKMASGTTCDYILCTGHMRPCSVGECRETGVFERRTRKKVKHVKIVG